METHQCAVRATLAWGSLTGRLADWLAVVGCGVVGGLARRRQWKALGMRHGLSEARHGLRSGGGGGTEAAQRAEGAVFEEIWRPLRPAPPTLRLKMRRASVGAGMQHGCWRPASTQLQVILLGGHITHPMSPHGDSEVPDTFVKLRVSREADGDRVGGGGDGGGGPGGVAVLPSSSSSHQLAALSLWTEHRSRTVHATLAPVWNQSFKLDLGLGTQGMSPFQFGRPDGLRLVCELWAQDSSLEQSRMMNAGMDNLLGVCHYEMRQLPLDAESPTECWLEC